MSSQKPFDPIRLLKEISADLLKDLFTSEGIPPEAALKALSRRDATSLFQLWDSLSPQLRAAMHIALQEVHVMSQELGLRVLAEQLEWHRPELIDQFTSWDNRLDKVVWVRLQAREAFEEGMVFTRADSLSAGRYWNRWNGLPPAPISVTEEQTTQLAALAYRNCS